MVELKTKTALVNNQSDEDKMAVISYTLHGGTKIPAFKSVGSGETIEVDASTLEHNSKLGFAVKDVEVKVTQENVVEEAEVETKEEEPTEEPVEEPKEEPAEEPEEKTKKKTKKSKKK